MGSPVSIRTLLAGAAAAVTSLTLLALPAQAQLTFYLTRASFDAANPGLPVEGFQNGASTTQTFTGPLNSATNNAAFQPGDILPGLTVVDNPGPDANGLFIAAAGQSTNPTTAVGSDFPGTDALDLQFSPAVLAAGMDIFQNFVGGEQRPTPQPYTVDIFGASGLLGSTVVNVAANGGSFFGVSSISGSEIVRISLSNAEAFEVIDNVAFGSASADAAAPEPGTVALITTGLLAAFAAAAVRKRRS